MVRKLLAPLAAVGISAMFAVVVPCMGMAQGTPTLSKWQQAIDTLDCSRDPVTGQDLGRSFDQDDIVSFALAWQRQSVQGLSQASEINLTDYVLTGAPLSALDDADGYAERFLATMPDALERFRFETLGIGWDICPVLRSIAFESLTDLAIGQEGRRGIYQPHARLAQGILLVNRCLADLPDGAFGPGSRAAWNAAAASRPDLQLADLEGPTPGMVVELARVQTIGLLCAPGSASPAGSMAVLHLSDACVNWQGITPSIADDVAALIARAGQTGAPDATERALSDLRSICRDPAVWNMSGDVLALALVRRLPSVTADLGAIDARVNLLLAALSGPPAGNDDSDPVDPAVARDQLVRVGVNLLAEAQSQVSPDLAVALTALALIDRTGGNPDSPLPSILHRIAEGQDGLNLLPALRARVQAQYRAAGAAAFALLDPSIRAARFDAAMVTGDGVIPLVETLIDLANRPYALLSWTEDPGEDGFAGSVIGTLRLPVTTTFAGVVPLNQLASLSARDDGAAALVALRANGYVAYTVATLMLEGFADAPKDAVLIAKARTFYESAANAGLSLAHLRLAQMHEQGYGVPRDPARAAASYERAAAAGQPEAELALARLYETGDGVVRDWARADRLYRVALGLSGDRRPLDSAHRVIAGRVVQRSLFFLEGPGLAYPDLLFDRVAALGPDAPYSTSDLAGRIAGDLLDAEAGLAPDPAAALRWQRLSVEFDADGPARAQLARLIRARPDLQAAQPDRMGRLRGPEELAALEDGTLEAAALASPSSAAVEALLDDRCDLLDRAATTCIAFAHRAAVGGGASAALIRPAHDWLRRAAAAEAAELASRGRLRPYREDSYSARPRPAAATLAMMDVAAFWGDYAGARALILPMRRLPFVEGLEAGSRNAVFRRMVARHVEGRPPQTWPAFETLLQALAQRGDDAAQGFLSLADPSTAGAGAPSATIDLAEARDRFAIAEPLGQESRGLGFAARRLATLEAAAGDVARATELELLAMETDLARADLAAVTDGPVPASLVRVCAWSHASERLFAIGQADLALVFARTAVNELQTIRAAIAGLPEQVQLCFRDTVADHYRWLADLFITQGRPADADQILMLLKSFETFRFVGNDIVYSGAATARMTAPPSEAGIVATARQVKPTVTGQAIRRRDLLLRKKTAPLTAGELVELDALNASLGAERAARAAIVQDLVQRAADLGRASVDDRLSDGKSIKRHLRSVESSRAAALQYVVLDNRIGIVLTTPVSQRAFVVDRIGDAPLSAKRLQAEIDAFRSALRDPSVDPRPAAQHLHNLLLPDDLLAELADGGIESLILSLDGSLRYIPFAALHDGKGWLVERYTLSLATDATVPQTEDPVEHISAFGSTRAIAEFSALPGVQRELRALVRGPGGEGLLDGVALLDEAFTRDSLAEALVFGDGFTPELGIVHIASHFKLGRTEADSFLLLGDGERLTLADLRAGFGIDLDFSEVGLLTLSACETGYGGGSDGAELESFAAVAQQEGARSVVATLWPVEDASIALVMEGIYARQRGGGVTLAEAITATQRGFLSGDPQSGGVVLRAAESLEPAAAPLADFPGYTHPFYWAPVVLMQGAS